MASQKQIAIDQAIRKTVEYQSGNNYVEALATALTAVSIAQLYPPADLEEADRIRRQYVEPISTKIQQRQIGSQSSNSSKVKSVTSSGFPSSDDDEDNKPCPRSSEDLSKNRFDDLIGIVREKEEIRETFVYPYIFTELYVRGKAILMYGPPGTKIIFNF
jgi:SpoVK/Ycf46/Vps4 family AAA+-type ATPase